MKRFNASRLSLLVALLSAMAGASLARADVAFDVQLGVPVETEYQYEPVYEAPAWEPGHWVWQDGERFWEEGHWESVNHAYYGPARWHEHHEHWHHEHRHEHEDDDDD